MHMTKTRCTDQVILDLWHPLAALSEVAAGVVVDTVLLEERLSFAIDGEGNAAVLRDRADLAEGSPVDIAVISGKLPLKLAYGYIWTSLGNPPADLFPIPEFDEVDRRKLNAATFGVNVSAPRAIENSAPNRTRK
jgi:hypothetical protein